MKAEVITIQIIRPDLDNLDGMSEQELVAKIALNVAEQIVKNEHLRRLDENIQYWQRKLARWTVEDILLEQKYGNQDTQ